MSSSQSKYSTSNHLPFLITQSNSTESCTHSDSCTDSCTHTDSCTDTCSHSQTNTCTDSCTHSDSCTDTYSHSQSTCTDNCSCDCSLDSETSGRYEESEIELGKKKYTVTFDKKCGHAMEDDIVDKVIYINGHQTPILKLTRGYTYYFNVKQKDNKHTFVLTRNPAGKIGCDVKPLRGSFDPVARGCVKYHVTACTPKYFYYQSSNDAFMGGLVIVEDNQNGPYYGNGQNGNGQYY